MDIPFKLSFKNHFNEFLVKHYVNKASDLYEKKLDSLVILTENLETSVLFQCDDLSARFYMDGLDTLPEYKVNEDHSGNVYLSPSDEYTTIFSFHQQEEYYPLIPGFYRVHVIANQKDYYALVKVTTKQISEEQWVIMRNEIEHTLEGLAQDFLRKNSSLGINEELPIPFSYFRKYYVFKKYESRILGSLNDIQRHPRSSILKHYEVVPRGQEKDIDEKTIRYFSYRPNQKDYLKTPVRRVNHDLSENSYLKKILLTFLKEIKSFLVFLEHFKKNHKNELIQIKKFHTSNHINVISKEKVLEELDKYEYDMKRIRGLFLAYLELPWMKEVTSTWNGKIPSVVLLDSRYRLLNQIHRLLQKNDFDVTMDSSFSYHWKRTDKLYEIWGFIQLINILKKLGFNPEEGWIYNKKNNEDKFHIPVLEDETTIVFKKNQISLRLVYDATLSYDVEQTTLFSPLYTSDSHNRPDARIDVYDAKGYLGTLIIDFKYRPVKNIWRNEYIRTMNQTKTMRQLYSYESNCRSKWLLKGRIPESLLSAIKPVREVWAVYPQKNNMIQTDEKTEQYNIRLISLTPGQNRQHFIDELKNIFEKITDISSQ